MKCILLKQEKMCWSVRSRIVKVLIAATIAAQLVACGGGSGGGGAASGSDTSTQTSSGATSASGSDTSTQTSSGATSASGNSTSNGGTSSGTSNGTSNGTSSPPSASATGSLSLSWVAPAARADGTPLSLADIDGFHIYYGNSAGSYSYNVNVTDGTVQTVTLKDLAIGTYYIVMTTYDVDGRESARSVVVKKTVS
jgi:hypothetical protein